MYVQEELALLHLDDSDRRQIERLSQETATPVDEVEAIYVVERARLQRMVKVKTFIPVLTCANLRKQLKGIG